MYSSAAPSSPISNTDAWLDALQLSTLPTDAKLVSFPDPSTSSPSSSPTSSSSSNRKRQRPFFADMKLEFAGFEVAASPPESAAAPPSYFADSYASMPAAQAPLTHMSQMMAASTSNMSKNEELLSEGAAAFFKALRLPLAQDPVALPAAVAQLTRQGFDTAAALAFASPDELQSAGLAANDVAAVVPAARQRFATAFAAPPALVPHVTVAHWLASCGIPKTRTFAYAEGLAHLGYAHTLELELALHDSRAISLFALGHGRLFLHCVAAAVHALQLQQQQSFMFVHPNAAAQPMMFAAGSSSAMLQPVDLQRDSELDALIHDGFLDALMDPAPDATATVSQPINMSSNDLMVSATDAMLKGTTTTTTSVFPAVAVTSSTTSGALRLPPPDVVQLLYEAVNLPRPNPCRRGKKVYWSVLATNGMKDPRFARLAVYSAAELQNAYLRQFELPAGHTSTPSAASSAAAAVSSSTSKSDAWSEENIKQLERAVKDPRCRHLSKVCWEMLATGRTGVDEYAPLAKFSASQLRSRFRSLFGDKRPQKLRQKKQMLKVQQLQMQQQHQQHQQHQQQQQQAANAVKKELVLL